MSDAWRAADAGALSWLESIASELNVAGYGVGPMPDKIWVLHPLRERLDGLPMREELQPDTTNADATSLEGDDPGATEPPERVLTWAEYARRRSIPLLVPPGYPSIRDALPGVWHDEYVSPPDEGEIDDSLTQQTLFDILLRHSVGLGATATAYYYWFWVGETAAKGQLPNVLHGPLASWRELFDRPDYVMGPQNIWPDDQSWVMGVHTDSWATEISGPRALIDELIACPELETIRLPHLD